MGAREPTFTASDLTEQRDPISQVRVLTGTAIAAYAVPVRAVAAAMDTTKTMGPRCIRAPVNLSTTEGTLSAPPSPWIMRSDSLANFITHEP